MHMFQIQTFENSVSEVSESRSREIVCYNGRIALKFDKQLGSTVAEVPVKFQSDGKSLNQNPSASRLREMLW